MVSYGAPAALGPLLASAARQTAPVEVRIWHNGPGPLEEVAALPEARSLAAQVLGGAGNLGFGAGINRLCAASEPGAPAIAIVANPDLILSPECAAELCAALAPAGLVVAGGALSTAPGVDGGPARVNAFRLQLTLDLLGINSDRGRSFDALATGGAVAAEYLGPSGALFAVHRARFAAQVGGALFTESLFLYMEDVALWIKLRRHRAGIAFAPRARAEHAFSQSSGQRSALKLFHIERNRLWLLRALYGTPRTAALLAFTAARYAAYLAGGARAAARSRPGGGGRVRGDGVPHEAGAAELAKAFRDALREGLFAPVPAELRDYLAGGEAVALRPYFAPLAAQLKNPVA